MMKKLCLMTFIVLLFGSIQQTGASESMSNYQEQIEKIFMSEAANKNTFKKAVQTSRLLGFLEFVQPTAFLRFHNCLSKEKKWDYLSAKKRQLLLDNCKAQGRTVSGVAAPAILSSLSVNPAANQKHTNEITKLRKEIYDLRNMIEKMGTEIKNNHDRTVESIRNFSQVSVQQQDNIEVEKY